METMRVPFPDNKKKVEKGVTNIPDFEWPHRSLFAAFEDEG